MTKTNLLLGAALAGILAATAAQAEDKAATQKEKCYGIAKAGKNDCASATGSHSCAGQSKADNDAGDFVNVDAGKCAEQGGKTEAPAAAK